MTKYLVAIIFCLFFFQKIQANHLVGGTMTYECLGNSQYKITLTIYRDCSSSTPFDTQAPISIYDGNNNLISTNLVQFQGAQNVPIIINNPCLVTPPNVCVEKTEYELVTNLPSTSSGGYNIVYQRCCRNSNAINIVNPSGMGATYKIHIPTPNVAVCNNSPVFNNPPPTTMCAGYEFTYDLSATDVDGDSLYYSFGDAINGGSSSNPAPNPPPPPPYSNITWNAGYSTNYQIDANPQFTIDPQTGYLVGTPTVAGFYTFSIKILEYRNGVYVGEIYRDFILVITNCQINTVASFPAQSNYCDGLTLNFTNNSINSSYYYWDFGDPSTNADTSLMATPSYTYVDTGVYTIMLVANPGYFCADTIYRQFEIYPKLLPSFVSPSVQCLLNNSFSLTALGNFDANAIINWDFGNSSIPSNATGTSSQVSFPAAGIYPIELTVQNYGCTENYFDTIKVYNNPTAAFDPQSVFCDGLAVQFNSYSLNLSEYYWDFGDLSILTDTANVGLPLYTYADSGTYNVMLIANQMNTCFDTTFHTFNVYSQLEVEFQPSSQCLINNLFLLNAVGNYNSNAILNWDFGTAGNPISGTGNQAQVSFLDTGFYEVNLSVQNYGCTSSYTDTLSVFYNPSPNFTFDADTGCQPFLVSFYDSSVSSTPLLYHWNFGDGGFSNQENPTYTYYNPGLFDVSLTIITSTGCVDTATFLLSDLITVNPKPVSKYKIYPLETYFLNHVIEVEDLSNVLYQEFNFGDGSIFTDRYIEYSYAEPGHYQFQQLVINEFGCSDTSFQNIWIKPDLFVFIPNSFTPDGDNLNDIFLPQIQGVIEYELELYDRWGKLFFKSNDLSVGWDGTYKGKDCQIDIYTWQVKVKSVDFHHHAYVGHVNLLR